MNISQLKLRSKKFDDDDYGDDDDDDNNNNNNNNNGTGCDGTTSKVIVWQQRFTVGYSPCEI